MSIDYTYEDLKMMAMSEAFAADASQKKRIFYNYREFLSDIHFIFVDENGIDAISPFRKMFNLNESNLVSMFSKDTLNVINEDILNGKTEISFSCDIGLDTQIISYIERYVRGVLDEHLVSTIKPLQIKRTLESEINIDAYIFENYLKNRQLDKIGKLSVWSVYYFLNIPLMNEIDAQIKADEALKSIDNYINYSPRTRIYLDRYYLCYSFLLKIVKLHFENISLKEKLIKLIAFENEEIFTIATMFINLAVAFWEQGTKLRFFGKVQKGKKDIIEVLQNMAWDLTHWVNTTLDCVYSDNFKSDLFVNLFYSIDNRFLELKNILKMECIAIDKKEKKAFPYYKNELDKFFTFEEQREFYGESALHKRNLYRKTVDTKELATKLKKELLDTNLFI